MMSTADQEHPRYRLVQEIVALSVADNWNAAKQEWELGEIFTVPDTKPGTCLCGHHPIIKHCVIRNRKNGN